MSSTKSGLTGRDKRLYSRICERMRAGDGFGHGPDYKPWLVVTRRNASPASNQIVQWMPPLRRTACYWSRGEYRTAVLLLWLGVADLREQYPIWPMPHPHPLDGAPGILLPLPWSKGLLRIAAEAGIEHGNEAATGVPYIATLDLLATVHVDRQPQLFAFSLKPITDSDIAIKWRTAERLELERRYAVEIGCPYRVVNSAIVPKQISSNLERWMACSMLDDVPYLLDAQLTLEALAKTHRDFPVRDLVATAARACELSPEETWKLLLHCAWHQSIDVDPSAQLLSSYPLPAGGQALRRLFRDRMFGSV